ncbi:MAG: hypothetical protein ACRDJN_31465, partial [Chloroflexota bacterium]
GRTCFDAAATAAAVALGLVVWSTMAHPWAPGGSAIDALVNEWIIWFTAFYLPLAAGAALLERWRSAARGSTRGAKG